MPAQDAPEQPGMPDPQGRPGRILCVPTPIGSGRTATTDLTAAAMAAVARIDYVIAENAKTARAFLKQLPLTRPLQAIEIVELNEHTREAAIAPMLDPVRAGRDAALMSEAGCPGVADPGARLILAAHQADIAVEPLIGPSALLLALMGSGLDGQRFAFAGYLPTEAQARRARLREIEQRSGRDNETQLFIETPYRNQAMFDALLATLNPSTWLCIGSDLTGSAQRLTTRRVSHWKRSPVVLDKVPTVFLLLAEAQTSASRPRR